MTAYENTYSLFHGTTNIFADKIISEKKFTFLERDDHWLGNGVYFFVDDYSKARWWANQACIRQRTNFKKHSPKATVLFLDSYRIHKDKMLDLDKEDGREKIRIYINELEKQNVSITKGAATVEQRRASLIQLYVRYYNIKASKKTFVKDSTLKYQKLESFGIENNEVQFCIYDNSTINFDNLKLYR